MENLIDWEFRVSIFRALGVTSPNVVTPEKTLFKREEIIKMFSLSSVFTGLNQITRSDKVGNLYPVAVRVLIHLTRLIGSPFQFWSVHLMCGNCYKR